MQLTRFFSLSLLTMIGSVLGGPIEKRETCHKDDDIVGKYCAFQTPKAWNDAVNLFCAGFQFGLPVPQGGSYGSKLDQMPDGVKGQQIFWGNYRVDNGGTYMINQQDCITQMGSIYKACGGYGGWINTKFGTVFGECIRK